MTPFRFLSRALAFAFLWLATSIANSEFMAGADISALPVLEAGGVTYSAGGAQGDAIELLSDSGVGWYRLRLFVNPENDSDPFVVNDLPYTIALAKRVKAAGGKLLLDFHYSDTWADPGSQSTPAAWSGLDFNQLSQRVYDYTQQAVAGMKAEGVLPEMVQIGNEISNGMLWPHGSPWTGGSNRTGFDRLATLLQAGINGAKAGAGPGDEPLVMIHHDRADRWDTTSYFFNQLVQRDVDFDVIGYSYYPKWHYDPQTGDGGLADVAENLNNTALAYGKPVVIAETGFASRGQQYEPTYEYPVSKEGQRQFLQALVDTVQAVPNGLGAGVFWWNADAVPAWPLPVWEGGRYGLFDQNGNLLPAASVFEAFLPTGLPGDFNGDGAVDAADYTTWRDAVGSGYTPGDHAIWAANYGAVTTTSKTVPEPASFGVAAVAMAIAAVRRRAP
jgi:arabinogalactan endo-1,4-beta-galactosidase